MQACLVGCILWKEFWRVSCQEEAVLMMRKKLFLVCCTNFQGLKFRQRDSGSPCTSFHKLHLQWTYQRSRPGLFCVDVAKCIFCIYLDLKPEGRFVMTFFGSSILDICEANSGPACTITNSAMTDFTYQSWTHDAWNGLIYWGAFRQKISKSCHRYQQFACHVSTVWILMA